MKRFKFHLKQIHEQSGLTAYAVAKRTGLSQTTVMKYTANTIVGEYVPMTVVILADFYGVDWRDPNVVETFIEDDPDEGQSKTPLAAA